MCALRCRRNENQDALAFEAAGRSERWQVLERREVFAAPPYLRVEADRVRLPDGRVIDDYYRITLPDFTCVFAETVERTVLLLQGYKHGTECVSLSFPGGRIEPRETPLASAIRELREETGYEADSWRPLGSYVTNGNHRCQVVHFFLAAGCRQVAEPRSGDLEQTVLRRLSRRRLYRAAREGELAGVIQMALLAWATHPVSGERRSGRQGG